MYNVLMPTNNESPIIIRTPNLTLDQELSRVQALDSEYAEELAELMNVSGDEPKQAIGAFLARFFAMLDNPYRSGIETSTVDGAPAFVAMPDTPAYDAFWAFDHEYLNYIPYN